MRLLAATLSLLTSASAQQVQVHALPFASSGNRIELALGGDLMSLDEYGDGQDGLGARKRLNEVYVLRARSYGLTGDEPVLLPIVPSGQRSADGPLSSLPLARP